MSTFSNNSSELPAMHHNYQVAITSMLKMTNDQEKIMSAKWMNYLYDLSKSGGNGGLPINNLSKLFTALTVMMNANSVCAPFNQAPPGNIKEIYLVLKQLRVISMDKDVDLQNISSYADEKNLDDVSIQIVEDSSVLEHLLEGPIGHQHQKNNKILNIPPTTSSVKTDLSKFKVRHAARKYKKTITTKTITTDNNAKRSLPKTVGPTSRAIDRAKRIITKAFEELEDHLNGTDSGRNDLIDEETFVLPQPPNFL